MKKLASLLLTLALWAGLAVPALAAGFSDVPPGHYAAEAIGDCVAKGVASGYADGTFRPDQPVTNAQFAVMMARAFFPEDLAEFQAQAEGKPWYWAACKAVTENRASVGFIFEGQWAKDVNKEVNRCQMAQGTPMVRICAGGYNDGIIWDDAGQPPHTRLNDYMGGADNSMQYVTLVFSRYPK